MSARDDGAGVIREIAAKHGFDEGAVDAMASAMRAGNGTMAQFNHPAFGGMGQWSRGGMLMIGDMFNDTLKGRVGALAQDLSQAMMDGRVGTSSADVAVGTEPSSGDWWPKDLGTPSSSGGQNGDLYAVFPAKRRLAVKREGQVTVYDTGDHRISGVSQQQGSTADLSFGTAGGTVRVDTLRRIVEEG